MFCLEHFFKLIPDENERGQSRQRDAIFIFIDVFYFNNLIFELWYNYFKTLKKTDIFESGIY